MNSKSYFFFPRRFPFCIRNRFTFQLHKSFASEKSDVRLEENDIELTEIPISPPSFHNLFFFLGMTGREVFVGCVWPYPARFILLESDFWILVFVCMSRRDLYYPRKAWQNNGVREWICSEKKKTLKQYKIEVASLVIYNYIRFLLTRSRRPGVSRWRSSFC